MMDPKIGIIGLGIMGSAISANLVKAGFAVTGYDIRPECGESLIGQGGMEASCVREVAEAADVVITALPSVDALQDVVSGPEGLLSATGRDRIVVEISTFPIDAKKQAADLLSKTGAVLLDCPLSGTGAQAAAKDLVVYASGDRQVVESCQPVFDGFARATYYIGEFGTGSQMKFIANLLVAVHNVASAEAFVLGMKAGLDPELIYRVISDGASTLAFAAVSTPCRRRKRHQVSASNFPCSRARSSLSCALKYFEARGNRLRSSAAVSGVVPSP